MCFARWPLLCPSRGSNSSQEQQADSCGQGGDHPQTGGRISYQQNVFFFVCFFFFFSSSLLLSLIQEILSQSIQAVNCSSHSQNPSLRRAMEHQSIHVAGCSSIWDITPCHTACGSIRRSNLCWDWTGLWVVREGINTTCILCCEKAIISFFPGCLEKYCYYRSTRPMKVCARIAIGYLAWNV